MDLSQARPHRRSLLTLLLLLCIALSWTLCRAAGASAAVPTGIAIHPQPNYPRQAATAFSAQVDLIEGETYSAQLTSPGITARLLTCSVSGGGTCAVLTNGNVQVVDDGDATPSESMPVTLGGTATPSASIPLTSTEGSPQGTTQRSFALSLTPTSSAHATVSGTTTMNIVTNPTLEPELELTTSLPTAGTVAAPGDSVPFRAVVTRTGNRAQETSFLVELVPSGATGGAPVGATSRVVMAPSVASTTVQLPVVIPSNSPDGPQAWHLQLVRTPDVEVGADRTFVVHAPPSTITSIPLDTTPTHAGSKPVGATKPIIDTTPPRVNARLIGKPIVYTRRGRIPVIPLLYSCGADEPRCVFVATVTWRPRRGARPVKLGTLTTTVLGGHQVRPRFHLLRAARTALMKYGTLNTVISITARDVHGNAVSGSLNVVLRTTSHH